MTGSPEPGNAVRRRLEAVGFDVAGFVDPAAYDRAAPPSLQSAILLGGCASVLVVGASRSFLHRALSRGGSDPLDRATVEGVAGVVGELHRWGERARGVLGHEPAPDGGFVDLVALGQAAGLGWPSRLGVLLHPTWGPWWSLRAAILTTLSVPAGTPLGGEGPCPACSAPCARACPGAAPRPQGFDIGSCAKQRSRPGPCELACAARRACVVGPEAAYGPDAEAHVMVASRRALLVAGRRPLPPGG